MMLRSCLAALAVLAWGVGAIPVDNGVEGDPEIECGPTSIIVNFNTQNPFEGHVYVKGLYATPGCRNDETGRQVAGITLPFDTCGTQRVRSLNPKGVFVSTTVVISFHPLFLTKVDRAYRIQCFYMEADKTVDADLDVSMLTTGFQSQQVPMPICRYEILDGGPTGPSVLFATVGQQIYHKWTCDTETVDTFCMIVHSCFVDDNSGDRVDLIGTDGCATDIYLLNNPEYLSDLMAGVEAHVFKYADRPQLYFQCQVTIVVKEPNQDCPRPNCAAPPGRGGPRPAGPLPPPPQNPFPLVQGGPYLPPAGQGQVPHGPGDPAAIFAAHPGRPDPNSFHQSVPRNRQQVPQPQGRPQPFQPQQPRRQPQPAPGQRRPFGGFRGNRRPFNRRAPFARRPFDAPPVDREEGSVQAVKAVVEARPEAANPPDPPPPPPPPPPATEVETRRAKRQIQLLDNAAGTMDVNVEISALDMEDVKNESPYKYNSVSVTQRSSSDVCMTMTGFVGLIVLSVGLIISVTGVAAFLVLRRDYK